MADIINIKKDGVTQYPITKPECVIDENGKNVLQLIRENAGGGSYDDTEIKQDLAELSAEVGKKQDALVSGTNIKTVNGESILGSGNITIQGGGGSGGDDTSLREAIFGKTTSKEFAINGYHAATADTVAVNIAQGEVFHFKLETLGAAITKYQLYVKYEGDTSQTTLFYFLADEHYSMYAQRPIVELGVNTSSGWVTEKGNVRLTVTQGGIKEPYNLMELGVITIEDPVDNIDVLEYVPDLLKFKKLKVLSQFTYSAERSKKGSIILNTENVNIGVAVENLMGAAINTHYIFDITLDKDCIDAYIECHSNSFTNQQIQDSNLGRNVGKAQRGNPIDAFVINLPLLAGDKFIFYGK